MIKFNETVPLRKRKPRMSRHWDASQATKRVHLGTVAAATGRGRPALRRGSIWLNHNTEKIELGNKLSESKMILLIHLAL